METREIIRALLQLLDDLESQEPYNPESNDENRFKQVADVLPDNSCGCETEYSNSPDEEYGDIDSVTDHAGGGINNPKHPADIRADSNAMYPRFKDYFDDLS